MAIIVAATLKLKRDCVWSKYYTNDVNILEKDKTIET